MQKNNKKQVGKGLALSYYINQEIINQNRTRQAVVPTDHLGINLSHHFVISLSYFRRWVG